MAVRLLLLRLRWLTPVLAFWLAGCATTSTKKIRLDPAEIAAEEVRQRELVLRNLQEQQNRLLQTAYPILRAATPLCEGDVGRRSGFLFHNAWIYEDEWREAAESGLGLGDTIQIRAVASGSPADRAGLIPGDRLLGLDGRPIPVGRRAVTELAGELSRIVESGLARFALTVGRAGRRLEVSVGMDEQCAYPVVVLPDAEFNAFADGQQIYVTAGMMRFASDLELAVLVSHELAHNAMGHIEAKMKNASLGAILGAVLDIASAASGYNTGGAFTRDFAALGAMRFSQDFETEADYVGLYALALAGIDLESAPNLWRQMATVKPEQIGFAGSHPTSAERFLRMAKATDEILYKRAQGLALRPEPKGAENLGEYPSAREGGVLAAAPRPDERTEEEDPPAPVPDVAAPPRETLPRAEVFDPIRAAPVAATPQRERRWGDRYWASSRSESSAAGFVPGPPPAGWMRLHEWVGDGFTQTESFRVAGQWRIVWRTGLQALDEPLLVQAFELPGDAIVASVKQEGESESSSLYLHRPGTFYLQIRGRGGIWYVAIEVPR